MIVDESQYASESLACPAGDAPCRFSQELVLLKQTVSQLTEMVRTDALTGLFNFRFLNETLALEMERVKRGTQPLAMILVDIDYFKKLNDTYGHEIGNHALVHIATLIKLAVRKLDIACRFGGEEFAILLPNTELPAAVAVAERLREMIASTPFDVVDEQGSAHTLSITASLGVDVYRAEQMDNPATFLQRTDHWLYEAKYAGRNKTCFPEIQEPSVDQSVSADEKEALFNLFSED